MAGPRYLLVSRVCNRARDASTSHERARQAGIPIIEFRRGRIPGQVGSSEDGEQLAVASYREDRCFMTKLSVGAFPPVAHGARLGVKSLEHP
jgi:hypothetical protein